MRETSAAEYAALANDVYLGSPKGSAVFSWTRQNFHGDPTNGFFAAAYQTPKTRKLVVAFRGTEGDNDWTNNAQNTAGLAASSWNSQLNTALAYFRAVRSIYSARDCAVCGHSLGGFLATMVALKENVPGVAFNPAPLGLSGASFALKGLVSTTRPRIVNFRLRGDLVSGLRTYNIGPVIELALDGNELFVRSSKLLGGNGGWLGDFDPIMHEMKLMKEAIQSHPKSDLAPDRWF